MNLLKRLMPKDSFYLVLIICISVLAVSGVWVSKGGVNTAEKKKIERNEEKQVALEETKIIEEEIKLDLSEKNFTRKTKKNPKVEVIPPVEDVAQVEKPIEKPVEKKEVAKIPAPKPEVKVETKQPEVKQAQTDQTSQAQSVASSSVEVKKQKLKKPVEGNIFKDFSKDKLVYSKTLEEWSTHLGIDIASPEGTDVVAPLDGIVKQVIKDERLGITIILDHGNGLETIYKNIATEKLVNTGQKVSTGQTISKVSKGVGFEKSEQPHLHFEVLQSGIHIDPKSMF